jgi:hypothetical protein
MVVQGDFSPLFRAGLRRDFRDTYEDWDTEYTDYMRVSDTTEPEIRATYLTGLNRLFERGDGEPISYEDPVMGPIAVAVDKEFAGGFMITKRTVEDDKYGKANQGAKWLAHAARLTYEYRAAALLDDAATGATFKTWDGAAGTSLLNTAHPLLNSSLTVANTPASQVQLSAAGISALFDLWVVLKDENGDPIREWPDTLIIGTNPGDINTALAIWNSELQPFTADNTDNVIRRRMPKPKMVVSHFKSNTKSYFLISSRMNDAHFIIRRPVEFDDTFDFDTDVAKYKATTRFIVVVFDWRGWSGCTPS